jgi:DMSO reductase anchor subunit
MSREGVMAVATLAVAVLMVAPLPIPHELAMRPLAALLALCALGTICSTAMIYASLKPIPAWRHPLVLPAYIGFALLTGGLAFAALPQPLPVLRIALPILGVLAIAMAVLKLVYWRAIDTDSLPQTRGDAIGLPNRKPSVFERPHTEANYLTKEMGFVVARKHAKKMRVFALLLFAVLPVVLVLLAIATSHPQPWLAVAALCAVAGAFVERWLFFAQAKHLVMLYY